MVRQDLFLAGSIELSSLFDALEYCARLCVQRGLRITYAMAAAGVARVIIYTFGGDLLLVPRGRVIKPCATEWKLQSSATR